ncbi:MAG: hypothetical protein Q4C66_05605 [Lachnospiraceae bacterium]|nr:hypothetical protein [Lachnospiraceae bacterium]
MMQKMMEAMMNYMQMSRRLEMPLLEMDFLNMEQASDLPELCLDCCVGAEG